MISFVLTLILSLFLLQRLRDQIKTWLASSEIKDKKLLTEDRKLIETQMERFKVLERETKTKAYSKEGLGGAAKQDPAQKEKDDTITWLTDSIDRLKIQSDKFESEIEAATIILKKKKQDKEKQEKIEEYQKQLEKHQYHMYQLEMLMRMLDNDTITCDNVKAIREDLEFYIDCIDNNDPDFTENEYMYSEIDGMDSFDEFQRKKQGNLLSLDGVSSRDNDDGESRSLPSNSPTSESPEESTVGQNSASLHSTQPHEPCSVSNHNQTSSSSSTTPSSKDTHPSKSGVIGSSSHKSTTSVSGNNKQATELLGSNHVNHEHTHPQMNSGTSAEEPSSNCRSPTMSPKGQETGMNRVLGSSKSESISGPVPSSPSSSLPLPFSKVIETPSSKLATSSLPSSAAGMVMNGPVNQVQQQTVPTSSSASPSSLKYMAYESLNKSSKIEPTINKIQNHPDHHPMVSNDREPSLISNHEVPAPSNVNGTTLPSHKPPHTPSQAPSSVSGFTDRNKPPHTPSQAPSSVSGFTDRKIPGGSVSGSRPGSESSPLPSHSFEAVIPPILGVAPLGHFQLPPQCLKQLRLLESASRHAIHPLDSQRLRYVISTPFRTFQPPTYPPFFPRPFSTAFRAFSGISSPGYYPQTCLPHSDSLEFYHRLSTESLFFIFYFMEVRSLTEFIRLNFFD